LKSRANDSVRAIFSNFGVGGLLAKSGIPPYFRRP
jgi:hypothetical protein